MNIMNNPGEFPVNLPLDERLLERLSSLRPGAPQGSIDSVSEEKLLRDLRQQCRRKSRLARFCRETAGGYWEAILISILFCLMGLDLLRIIRLLLR